MADSMIERMKVALRPLLHHGLDAYPDVETEAARRVLAAMREPDPAFWRNVTDQGDTAEGNARALWQHMIDAALAEDGQ